MASQSRMMAQWRRDDKLKASLERIARALRLHGRAVETALNLHDEAIEDATNRNRVERDSLAAALLLIVCDSRSANDFEVASGLPRECHERIDSWFWEVTTALQDPTQALTTQDLIQRLCWRLSLSNTIQAVACTVAQRADALGLTAAKSPISVAAVVVYLTAAHGPMKRALQDICDKAMISNKTAQIVFMEFRVHDRALFADVFPKNATE